MRQWCTAAGPCLSRKKSTPGTGIHNSEACASGAWRPGRVFVHGKCSAPEFSLTPHAPMVHGGRAVSLAQKEYTGHWNSHYRGFSTNVRGQGGVRARFSQKTGPLHMRNTQQFPVSLPALALHAPLRVNDHCPRLLPALALQRRCG